MNWPGGKGASGAVQAIINQQPPHSVYVEPFVGGGAVLLAKSPAISQNGFDLDAAAIDRLRVTAGGIASFDVTDGIEWLERVGPKLAEHALIYCDPPYLFSARARARRIYRYELTDVDHRRFLRAVLGLRCMVQISGYWSSLYAEMLEGWRTVTFEVATRGTALTGKKATEWLWMNYPEPKELHDYSYVGSDYRERERIKRKAARWAKRVSSLPDLERAAIMTTLQGPTAKSDVPGSLAGFTDRRRPKSSILPVSADGDRATSYAEAAQ